MPPEDDAFAELNLIIKFPGPGVVLWGLEEYLVAIEEQLSHLKAQYRVRLKARLKRDGRRMHKDDIEFAEYEVTQLTEELFPRLLRGAYLVALWAAFESVVTDMANYAKSEYKQPFGLDELRAGDFLAQAEKYYVRVLHLDLFTDRVDRKHIEMLKGIRNALVHDNGHIDGLPKEVHERLKRSKPAETGVELRDYYIIPTADGLRHYFSVAKRCLEGTYERVFSKLHPEVRHGAK